MSKEGQNDVIEVSKDVPTFPKVENLSMSESVILNKSSSLHDIKGTANSRLSLSQSKPEEKKLSRFNNLLDDEEDEIKLQFPIKLPKTTSKYSWDIDGIKVSHD